MHAVTPPTIESYAFDSGIERVYVPCEAVKAYQAADGWKDLNLQCFDPSTALPEVANTSEKRPVRKVLIDGKVVIVTPESKRYDMSGKGR